MAGITWQAPLSDVKERDYVSQIPLDMLFKNMSYKQAQFDQDVQNTVQNLQSLEQIKGLFPQDQARANELNQQLNNSLQELAKGNLTNNNTKTQINNLISQVTPELSSIQARGAIISRIQKEKEDAMKKGLEYFNPAEDEIVDYAQSGKYDPNKTFNSDAIYLPKIEDVYDAALKAVPEETKIETKDGYVQEVKFRDQNKLNKAVENILANTPGFNKYIQHQWNKTKPQLDLSTEGIHSAYNKTNNLKRELYLNQTNLAALTAKVLNYKKGSQERTEIENKIKNYLSNIEEINQALPTLENKARVETPESIAFELQNTHKNNIISQYTPNGSINYGEYKETPDQKRQRDFLVDKQMENLKHRNDLIEKQYEEFYKYGIDPNSKQAFHDLHNIKQAELEFKESKVKKAGEKVNMTNEDKQLYKTLDKVSLGSELKPSDKSSIKTLIFDNIGNITIDGNNLNLDEIDQIKDLRQNGSKVKIKLDNTGPLANRWIELTKEDLEKLNNSEKLDFNSSGAFGMSGSAGSVKSSEVSTTNNQLKDLGL